jgi:acyl-CoA synthetase (AMP-forming)/AMP-acid ligase II
MTELVSCGPPAGQLVAIVDPESGAARGPGQVGEIWVHGENVAGRYWRQPDRTREVFEAVLVDPPAGYPGGPWLRTGDLGLRHDGELYITGRLKDLLIVAGRNHYPQDIEATVADSMVEPGRVAAFAVAVEGEDRVVVVVERRRGGQAEWRPDEVARSARQAVWRRHELALQAVVPVEPGEIPRTSSGKVSRTACRERYLAGQLALSATA